MRHLRFVHNTQTILSAAVLYLVYSTWTSGPELRQELEDFLQLVEYAKVYVERRDPLTSLVPEMPNHNAALASEVNRATGHSVWALAPFRIRSVRPLPEKSAPVGAQWRALQDQQWTVQTLGNPEHGWTEVRAWLDERRSNLARALRGGARGRLPRLKKRKVKRIQDRVRHQLPIVRLSVTDWPAEAKFVAANVQIVAYVAMTEKLFSEGAENITSPAEYRDLHLAFESRVVIARKTFGPFQFVSRTNKVQLPSSAFDRYPHLQQKINVIKDLTPTEALAWAADQQVAGIREREPELLGISTRGEDLGRIGPIVLLSLFVYLLLMLRDPRISVEKQSYDPRLLPWLAARSDWFAKIYSSITLIILPAGAVFLLLWRFTTTSWLIRITAVAIVVAIGIAVFCSGMRLGACEEAPSAIKPS